MKAFLKKSDWYIKTLRGWLEYLGIWDRVMFGTDWPLANLEDYIEYTKALIPEEHWDDIFWKNAARIYHIDNV